MKLGSNRKSIGMGAGYREFSYDNKRVREVFKILINKIGHSSRSSSIQRSKTTGEESGNDKQF